MITNDDVLAEKIRMYSNHGALKKHNHQIEGINSRLDGLQAAILSVKLPHILNWTAKRIANAKRYNELLASCEEITCPVIRDNTKHTFHLYVIRTDRRDELKTYLNEKGIATAIHYPTALPFMPAYEYLGGTVEEFPIAHAYQNKILSLPMCPELSDDQIRYVAETVHAFFAE